MDESIALKAVRWTFGTFAVVALAVAVFLPGAPIAECAKAVAFNGLICAATYYRRMFPAP